jgi:putative transposase
VARLARLSIAGHPHHVLLRAAGGLTAFRTAEDFRCFLDCLRVAAAKERLAIHAYVLMPKHVRLLVTPPSGASIGRAMQSLGRRYVRWFNARYQRRGRLWGGRYRCSVIEAAEYLLDCARFIETEPIRAALTTDAASYPWSSLRHHLGLVADAAVTDHAIAWGLGNTPFERQSAYRALLGTPLSEERIRRLEWGAEHGWAVGSEHFLTGLGRESQRRLTPGRRGRPRRNAADDLGDLGHNGK